LKHFQGALPILLLTIFTAMNTDALKQDVAKKFKLRPTVQRRTILGQALPAMDDWWELVRVTTNPKGVELRNLSTGHVAVLEADNVKEYRSPHFLILKCRLYIGPEGLAIEPLT
jgi:hypothetical protein